MKCDGFWLIARKIAGRVHRYTREAMIGRSGFRWSPRDEGTAAEVDRTGGEALCFTATSTSSGARSSAFHLLGLNGVDWRAEPMLKRNARRRKLLARDIPGLQYIEHIEATDR